MKNVRVPGPRSRMGMTGKLEPEPSKDHSGWLCLRILKHCFVTIEQRRVQWAESGSRTAWECARFLGAVNSGENELQICGG